MKLIDRKNTNELMKILDGAISTEIMVREVAVRWYGHILEREGNILKVSQFKIIGQKKMGRPKAT